MARHTAVAGGILAGSLLLGVLGYHFFDELRWIDALVDAAMLLGGMGPVSPLRTTRGKLFAAFFALYAGLIFLVAAGVLLAPVAHRLLHHFHLENERKRGNGGRPAARGNRKDFVDH